MIAKPAYERILLPAILLAAVAVRLSDLAAVPPALPASGDAREYHEIAQRWLTTGRYLSGGQGVPKGRYAVRTPGYPALLMALYASADRLRLNELFLVRAANIAMDVATCLMVFLAGQSAGNPPAGLIAASLAAFSPSLRLAATQHMPETLTTFLICAGFLAMTAAFQKLSLLPSALSGFFFGLASLVRPTLVLFPAAFLVASWPLRARLARLSLCAVLFVGSLCAAVSPWAVRNALVFGRPVPLSSLGGLNLWAGNYLPFHGAVRPATYNLMQLQLPRQPRDEMDADAMLTRAGLRQLLHNLVAHPLAFSRLVWRKHQVFWECYGCQGRPGGVHRLVLLLALVGIGLSVFEWTRLGPAVTIAAYLNLVHLAAYVEPGRYSATILPEVFFLAAFGVVFLAGRGVRYRQEVA
jgi:4-amino-4-deoxy-L-arabinose transferase-like glycosyltransferase